MQHNYRMFLRTSITAALALLICTATSATELSDAARAPTRPSPAAAESADDTPGTPANTPVFLEILDEGQRTEAYRERPTPEAQDEAAMVEHVRSLQRAMEHFGWLSLSAISMLFASAVLGLLIAIAVSVFRARYPDTRLDR